MSDRLLEDTVKSMDIGGGGKGTFTGSRVIKAEISARISKALLSLEHIN